VGRVIGYPGSPRLDVKPIVQSVIDAVESGELLANGALIRDAENQLRIKVSVLIPVDGPMATVRVRRERFRTAIEKAMNAIGVGTNNHPSGPEIQEEWSERWCLSLTGLYARRRAVS
jgi:hypothetical protein